MDKSGMPLMRIPEVNEAVEIVIELGERSGDLENLKRAAWYVVGGDEAFLRTAARRLKYEYLLWRVVSKDDVGKAPGDVIYGAGLKWDTSFRIERTKPEGEVQITPRTVVTAKYIEVRGA